MVDNQTHGRSCSRGYASRKSRASERGAVIFVVLLVLSVLTAIGLMAARMAGLNQRVSGYSRQSTQTGYVAEYGVTALATELSGGRKQIYTEQMRAASDTCSALYNMPNHGTGSPCYQIMASEFQKRLDEDGLSETYFAPSGGSFGPDNTAFHVETQPLTGDFRVEMTDPGPAAGHVPGTEGGGLTKGFLNMQYTLTSIGQVRLHTDPGATCTSGPEQQAAQVAGTRSMRVYVTVPYVAQ